MATKRLSEQRQLAEIVRKELMGITRLPKKSKRQRAKEVMDRTYILDIVDCQLVYRKPYDKTELLQDNAYVLDFGYDGGFVHTRYKDCK